MFTKSKPTWLKKQSGVTINFLSLMLHCIFAMFSLPLLGQNDSEQRSSSQFGVDFNCVACEEKWRKAEPITPNPETQSSPPSLEFFAPSGSSQIKFGVRFSDNDQVRFSGTTCGDIGEENVNTWLTRVYQNAAYEISFRISANEDFSNFNNNENEITTGSKVAAKNPNFTIWENENVGLTTGADWDDGDIEIQVSISDISVLPAGGPLHEVTGSCDDNSLQDFRTYVIKLSNNIPKKLKQHADSPDNDTWDVLWDAVENGYLQAYKYIGFPTDCDDVDEDFESHIINEEHENIQVAFVLDDIKDDWIDEMNIEGIDDNEIFNGVLGILFPYGRTGSEASFVLNASNEFEDVHGHLLNPGYNDPNEVELVFNNDAIINNRVSYSFTQEYRNLKNELITTNTLTREYRNQGGGLDWYIKKNHIGICD